MKLSKLLEKITNNDDLSLDEQNTLNNLLHFLQGKTFEDVTLEYILIRQKDAILERIPYDPDGAEAALKIVTELWNNFNYSYKVAEIQNRINNYRRSLEHDSN